MIVRINTALKPSLEDGDNFRAFKVVTDTAEIDVERLNVLLGPAIVFETAEQAWIEVEALKRWASRSGDSDWIASLDGMVAYARTRGWVREMPLRLAAHVEHADR
ncbi:hypothetical protein [Oceanibacterium hippocampi]|uniref:Uncharacterized protein n=1 Tax=Oceanibacterium hippocampi TaxID=745714 RepID=A0A1Y5SL22_9PROT|nr:hypothetical protein [Oceanibacterium hippocampi]SLN42049.1 hypothetical protein OCH7691_01776 [Oceanibacterium hippocampi]